MACSDLKRLISISMANYALYIPVSKMSYWILGNRYHGNHRTRPAFITVLFEYEVARKSEIKLIYFHPVA